MQNPGVINLLEADGIRGLDEYRHALQHSENFPSQIVVAIHYYSMLTFLTILFLLLTVGVRLLNVSQLWAIVTIIVGIILNDLFAAAITYPQDRFETRVIWLVPTIVTVLCLSIVKQCAERNALQP